MLVIPLGSLLVPDTSEAETQNWSPGIRDQPPPPPFEQEETSTRTKFLRWNKEEEGRWGGVYGKISSFSHYLVILAFPSSEPTLPDS